MHYIIKKADNKFLQDGECELQAPEFCLGAVFNEKCTDYAARKVRRDEIIEQVAKRWVATCDLKSLTLMLRDFMDIHPCFPREDELPFVSRLYEYDRQKPLDVREARNDLVRRMVTAHLCLPEKADYYIKVLQLCVFIYPPHLVPGEVAVNAVAIANTSSDELAARRKIFMPVWVDAQFAEKNKFFMAFTQAQRFYAGNELAQAAADWIRLGQQNDLGLRKFAYLETLIHGQKTDLDYRLLHATLVRRAADLSYGELVAEARLLLSRLQLLIRDRDRQTVMTFCDALNGDFDFGDQGELNRKLWRQREAIVAADLEELRPEIERHRKTAIKEESANSTNSDDSTAEAIWAWPIDKIVEYIGPVGRKGRGRRKQKKKITPRVSETTVEIKDATADDDIAEVPQEDQAMLELGLRNSLVLFYEEAQDALSLAEKLNIRSESAVQLEASCPELLRLAESDDLRAEDCDFLLTRFGEWLGTLRQEFIAEDNEDNRPELNPLSFFRTALTESCGAEKVIYGKRFGGVIDCALDLGDWGIVNEAFHNRMVRGCNRIRVGRRWRYLAPDEAIAFYVTFTSRSGYAFDVSAHLWRRYEDAGTAPAALPSDDDYPPMDEDNWYDSYIPCFVLHVPFRH